MERTLILLKPDCVERRLVGRIISRFEDKGFNIVALKMLQVTPKLARQHYAEHVKKPFYPGLEAFITGAPVVAMILEGLDVIRVVRELLGATSGLVAEAGTCQPPGGQGRMSNRDVGSPDHHIWAPRAFASKTRGVRAIEDYSIPQLFLDECSDHYPALALAGID